MIANHQKSFIKKQQAVNPINNQNDKYCYQSNQFYAFIMLYTLYYILLFLNSIHNYLNLLHFFLILQKTKLGTLIILFSMAVLLSLVSEIFKFLKSPMS